MTHKITNPILSHQHKNVHLKQQMIGLVFQIKLLICRIIINKHKIFVEYK